MQRLRAGDDINTVSHQTSLSREAILILYSLSMRREELLMFCLSPHLSVWLDPNYLPCPFCPENGRETGPASEIHHDLRPGQVDQLGADIQENIWSVGASLIVQCHLAGPDIDGFCHAECLSFHCSQLREEYFPPS
jgi:hypothetical protein